MKTRTIEITVQPDGKLEIEALGFTGADCEKATAFIEDALGRPVSKRKKPEYYRRKGTLNTRRQILGGGNG